MLTPQQITELAETLYPALDDLNQWITQDMVKRLMARLGRGEAAVLKSLPSLRMQRSRRGLLIALFMRPAARA